MIEKKSKRDSSRKSFKVGVKNRKSTAKRAGKDTAPEFQLNTGWPKKKYKKNNDRVRATNPSHEGEEWFKSEYFNDSETNKRPMHPQKDYLNRFDSHTGDDYLEMGHENLEDKVKYSENPNLDQKNYKKGGVKKIKRDGWTGNDHLNIKKEKPKKNDPQIIGYAPPLKYNLDKKPDIYKIDKVNENIKNMKALNEQTSRIKQMILFKDGMSYKDVKKLTEAHDGGFGDAVDLGRSTTAYTVGPDDAKLQSTWAHNLGDGLADAPENIYAVVTADGRQVTPEDGVYSTDDFNVEGNVTTLYRGVSGGEEDEGISYYTPTAGDYGATVGETGKVLGVSDEGRYASLSDQPWYWGSYAAGAQDPEGLTYSSYGTEEDYTSASRSAQDEAKPWQSRQLTPPTRSPRRGSSLGVRARDYSTESAYEDALKSAVAKPQQNPQRGKSRKGGTGAGKAGGYEAPVMNLATGKATGTKGNKKGKKLSENTMKKRIKENNDMRFWGGKRPITERYRPRTKKVRLTESQLIQVIEKTVKDHLQEKALGIGFTHNVNGFSNPVATRQQEMGEAEQWMQKVDKDIDKRGTEGSFHDWCKQNGHLVKDKVTCKCVKAGKNSDDESIVKKATTAGNYPSVNKGCDGCCPGCDCKKDK